MRGTACWRTHLGPVSEGDDEWEDEGLLIGQSRQVGGGLAGMVVPCTHFAHQPAVCDNNNIHVFLMEKCQGVETNFLQLEFLLQHNPE